ncbi:SHOCT domain-containing protein [Sinomonas humi]|uniref:hypothetical protein n=1 Tax=Sinomonas humi TaxID=1338436 RepID=UPI000690FF99|nr:hypothetical protein [Sinomonas humi]
MGGGLFVAILLLIVIALLVVIAVRLFMHEPWHGQGSIPPGAVPPLPGHPPGQYPGPERGAGNPSRQYPDPEQSAGNPSRQYPGPEQGAPGPTAPVPPIPSPPGRSRARRILDERLVSGEITPEQYRELKQTLEEQ